jgi:hypothetical protein
MTTAPASRKGLGRILPLLLLLALGGVALWLWRSRSNTTLAGPMADFAVRDTANIDRIFIAQMDGHTADLRRAGDHWTVNGMPANQVPINTLLKTFIRVEVKTPVPMSMQANVLKTMSTLAVKVEIYTGDDKPEKIWWVGHGTQDHFGVFAVLEKPGEGRSDSPFVLGMTGFTGIINTRFHARLDEWRSSDVAVYKDLSKVSRVQVEHPSSDSPGYTILYNGKGTLQLKDTAGRDAPIDTSLVRDLMMHLTDAHFEYFERTISKAQRDSVLATKPWHVLTVTTTAGASKRIPFWRKNPNPGERDADFNLLTQDVDRMYCLVDDSALVVVQRYWFDRMVPNLEQLAPR